MSDSQKLITPQARRAQTSRPIEEALETHRGEMRQDIEKDRAIQRLILRWSIAAAIFGGLALLIAVLNLLGPWSRRSPDVQQIKIHNSKNDRDDLNDNQDLQNP